MNTLKPTFAARYSSSSSNSTGKAIYHLPVANKNIRLPTEQSSESVAEKLLASEVIAAVNTATTSSIQTELRIGFYGFKLRYAMICKFYIKICGEHGRYDI